MHADLGGIGRGSNHADTAAGHVHDARSKLLSTGAVTDMFGRTKGAANAHDILSRAQERHAETLADHHRKVTWIRENTAGAAAALDFSDLETSAIVRRAGGTEPPA